MQTGLETLRSAYDYMEAGDWANPALLELLDPDVVFVRIGVGSLSGEWRGVDATVAAVSEYLEAWDDIRTSVERLVELDDGRILALDRQTGVGKGSGVVVEHEIGWLITVRDGRIVRFEGYWDRAEAMHAAGLEP